MKIIYIFTCMTTGEIVILIVVIIFGILNQTKLLTMGEQLDAIKAELDSANEKVTRIAADVQRLHDLISGTGETPTPEEWQEVKDKAAALNASLQSVDDATPE